MLFLLESSQWTEVTGDPLCLLSKIMVQHSTLNLMQYQPGWIRCIRCGWCNSGAVLTQGDAMQCMQWWCHYLDTDWVTTLPYQSPLLLFTRRVSSRTKRKGMWWLCRVRSWWLIFLSLVAAVSSSRQKGHPHLQNPLVPFHLEQLLLWGWLTVDPLGAVVTCTVVQLSVVMDLRAGVFQLVCRIR